MENKKTIILTLLGLSRSAIAYDPSLINPSDHVTPTDFIPRLMDAIIQTMHNSSSLFASQMGQYLAIFLIAVLIGMLVYAFKYFIGGSK